MVKAYESPSLVTISANSLNSTSANVSSGGGHTGTGGNGGGSTGGGASGDGTSNSSISAFENVILTNFAFDQDTASLIAAVWVAIQQKYYAENKVTRSWFFFRFFGSIIFGEDYLRGVAWGLVAGYIVPPDIFYSNAVYLGLDASDYLYLSNKIHDNYEDDGLDGEESQQKVDFAHLCITIATHLNTIIGTFLFTNPIFAAISAANFNATQMREGLAGWLGDTTLRPGGITPGDYLADLDAVNISAKIIQDFYNPITAFNYYYNNVAPNRVASFMMYLGRSKHEISAAIWETLIRQGHVPVTLSYYTSNYDFQISYYQSHFPDIIGNFLDHLPV
jgi:hypothetical protein